MTENSKPEKDRKNICSSCINSVVDWQTEDFKQDCLPRREVEVPAVIK